MNSRKYILDRRGSGISNLQASTMENGELDLDQAVSTGIYKLNCTHQVGIATSTEVGLSADRYAIRVILAPDTYAIGAVATDTVCSYWKVLTAGGLAVPFSRKPLSSDLAVRNLYNRVPDIDERLWTICEAVRGKVNDITIPAETEAARTALYDILSLVNPTDEQLALIPAHVGTITNHAVTNNRYPWFKIAEDRFLVGEPHGSDYQSIGTMDADRVALYETLLCAHINYARLKAKYDRVSDGLITAASYAIANMFRMGLQESYEHREYYTLVMGASAQSTTSFAVRAVSNPPGAPPINTYPVGTVIDISRTRVNRTLVELASSCVVGSGMMHYLFNHTTGGNIVNGTLLTTLSMYQLITSDMPNEMQVEITTVLYEALHPTNKRAIANIFFKNSGVSTSGRCASNRKYERLSLDSFMALRSNPYPAGSHKAFICTSALKRVLQAGLGPFLPWADQMSACIQTCREVLQAGARAHIGSGYYTGEPPKAQPSSIDAYLPELAQYVNTFNKTDSLAMSPHMSNEIAKRSNMNWQNMLKELKAKDVSAANVDVVRQFLATSGSVHFTFNPEDQSTWGKAVADASVALTTIDNIFN